MPITKIIARTRANSATPWYPNYSAQTAISNPGRSYISNPNTTFAFYQSNNLNSIVIQLTVSDLNELSNIESYFSTQFINEYYQYTTNNNIVTCAPVYSGINSSFNVTTTYTFANSSPSSLTFPSNILQVISNNIPTLTLSSNSSNLFSLASSLSTKINPLLIKLKSLKFSSNTSNLLSLINSQTRQKLQSHSLTNNQLIVVHTYANTDDYTTNGWRDFHLTPTLAGNNIVKIVSYSVANN